MTSVVDGADEEQPAKGKSHAHPHQDLHRRGVERHNHGRDGIAGSCEATREQRRRGATQAHREHQQVKDTDGAVSVFDITGADVTSPPDFLQKLCGPEPTLSVFATGTADIHQQFNASVDGSFRVTFMARGHVSERAGPGEWRLEAVLQEAGNFIDGTTDRLREQVRLR